MSTMLADRVRGALGLWRAGKVDRILVIATQGFHVPRALYLADQAGIDATGFTTDFHGYGIQGTKSDLREILSRVKAVADTPSILRQWLANRSRSPAMTAASAGAHRPAGYPSPGH
jgi:vancomycin permeability regulator SanA